MLPENPKSLSKSRYTFRTIETQYTKEFFDVLVEESPNSYFHSGVGSITNAKLFGGVIHTSGNTRVYMVCEGSQYLFTFPTVEEADMYIAAMRSMGEGTRTEEYIVPKCCIGYSDAEGYNVMVEVEYGLLDDTHINESQYRGIFLKKPDI